MELFVLNHSAPSGPTVIRVGPPLLAVYSVMIPAVVIRPILPPSVNQRAPSGPATMSRGYLPGHGSGNSVIWPPVVIPPILLPSASVNHNAPSGPAAIFTVRLLDVGIG